MPFKVGQGSLFKAWKLIRKLYLVECPQLTDSVQSIVFLSAHFLTFICFLSIATCFDFLTVCELFPPISTRLLIVSACLYLLTSRFYQFLLVYHLPVVSTRLLFTSRFYSFASHFYSFLLIYQMFLFVQQPFHILVLTQETHATSYINETYY